MAPHPRSENRDAVKRIQEQNFWKNHSKILQNAPKKRHGIIENRFVKMQILNIPLSFKIDQLKVFFEKYTVSNVMIDVNESGEPIGTGSVMMKTSLATKIIENSSQLKANGVSIDLKLDQTANNARRRLFPTNSNQKPSSVTKRLRELLQIERKVNEQNNLFLSLHQLRI
ncbi:unnamed protein product [Caenorhabditis brenneri]